MKLFDMFKSKKETAQEAPAQSNASSFAIPTMNKEEAPRGPGIMVLGTGCTKCKALTVIAEKP